MKYPITIEQMEVAYKETGMEPEDCRWGLQAEDRLCCPQAACARKKAKKPRGTEVCRSAYGFLVCAEILGLTRSQTYAFAYGFDDMEVLRFKEHLGTTFKECTKEAVDAFRAGKMARKHFLGGKK